MNDQERKLIDTAPSDFPRNPALFLSGFGFLTAILSAVLTQFIWVSGPFGNAHLEDIAMIAVLAIGALAAFIGCVSSVMRTATVTGPVVLFGIFNLFATFFLVYAVISICHRMY